MSSKEKRMLFLGGGSRGESRCNGQNQNQILTGYEHVITNNVTMSKKWVKTGKFGLLSGQTAFPSS